MEFSIAWLQFKQPEIFVIIIHTIRVRNVLTCTNFNFGCTFLRTNNSTIGEYINCFFCSQLYSKIQIHRLGFFIYNSNRPTGCSRDSGFGLLGKFADWVSGTTHVITWLWRWNYLRDAVVVEMELLTWCRGCGDGTTHVMPWLWSGTTHMMPWLWRWNYSRDAVVVEVELLTWCRGCGDGTTHVMP